MRKTRMALAIIAILTSLALASGAPAQTAGPEDSVNSFTRL